MLPASAPDGPVERVGLVVDALTNVVAETESQQPTMLRLSLGTTDPLPLRQGRAIGWFTEALEPAVAFAGNGGSDMAVVGAGPASPPAPSGATRVPQGERRWQRLRGDCQDAQGRS